VNEAEQIINSKSMINFLKELSPKKIKQKKIKYKIQE